MHIIWAHDAYHSIIWLGKPILIRQQALLMRQHAGMKQLQQYLRLFLGAADHGQAFAQQRTCMLEGKAHSGP
jgi:hypothetical protein